MKDTWISVKDKLPDFSVNILVLIKEETKNRVEIGRLISILTNERGSSPNWETDKYEPVEDVTHWQPILLPESQK